MTIVFAILLFSLLIFVHELGHFTAAKLFGVQVNEFSMFMGPAIFKKRKGETLYSIRLIPFGGYCAMEGENGDSENPRAFTAAKWWKRLIILIAGSLMNLIIGLLLFVIVRMPAHEQVIPVIDSFEPFSTVDGEEGLQVGDRILEVDGETIYFKSDIDMIFTLNPGQTHDILLERNGQEILLDDFYMELHAVERDGKQVQMYGLTFQRHAPSFGEKLEYAWYDSVNSIRTVRISLQMLFSGEAGVSDMSGPVGLVDHMNQVAEESETTEDAVLNVLSIGGLIAINLAVMNMLPIPALDGGRAVGLLITTGVEKVTRKKVNPKYEGWIHAIGMIPLLALMVYVLFKDVFTIFTR